MASHHLEKLLNSPQFTAHRVNSAAAALRAGKEVVPPHEPGGMNALSLFIYMHLRHYPERFDVARPLLDALSELGQSPFEQFRPGQPSVYLDMLGEDDSHPIIAWCLDLPCAPASAEPDRARRIRSDTLEGVLLENPSPGSGHQIATLDLFGFKLLEQWSDGRTTLDRLLDRYYQHTVVEGAGPRKDFEFTEPQRGFTRLLAKVLSEDTGSEHVYAIRGYAWDHAHLAHERLQKGLYRKWGTEMWQAALRQFDKILARSMGLDAASIEEKEETLWTKTIEYAWTRTSDKHWPEMLAGAAWYQLLDARQRLTEQDSSNDKAGRQRIVSSGRAEKELLRGLDIASVMMHLWKDISPEQLMDIYRTDVGVRLFAKSFVDALPTSNPGPSSVIHHPAFIPAILPLVATNSLFGNEERKVFAAVEQCQVLPGEMPWVEIAAMCQWPASVQSHLDGLWLRERAPISNRSSPRRM